MNSIVDKNFGIGKQALAVLQMLDRSPDFAEYENGFYQVNITTRPWYNGRESGFYLSMNPSFTFSKKWIHIAVFEHRNSDEICALKWETDRGYWNHALEDKDIFEIAYGKGMGKFDVAHSVKYGEIGNMADWVYEQLSQYYKENYKPSSSSPLK